VGCYIFALVGVVARHDVGIYPHIFHFAAQQRQALINLIHIIIFLNVYSLYLSRQPYICSRQDLLMRSCRFDGRRKQLRQR
jgi:hypothetical protein